MQQGCLIHFTWFIHVYEIYVLKQFLFEALHDVRVFEREHDSIIKHQREDKHVTCPFCQGW